MSGKDDGEGMREIPKGQEQDRETAGEQRADEEGMREMSKKQDQNRNGTASQRADRDQKNKIQKKAGGQERSGKNETRRMDNKREIYVTGFFFAAVFAVLIGYLGYFTATSQEQMINNSYNSRQEILLSRNYRGTIYSRDGEVLAETVLDEMQN